MAETQANPLTAKRLLSQVQHLAKRVGGLLITAVMVFNFSPSALALESFHGSGQKNIAAGTATMETMAAKQHEATAPGEHVDLGKSLPLWSGFPFAGILLSIALFPLLAPRFWHHHFGKVTAAWALVFAIPFVLAYHGAATHEILHIYLKDYIPFIILLWSLYTVAGGILVEGAPVGTPRTNTIMLAIGTLIASWVGTTGASMLLIRPMLRMNQHRQNKVHVIIFFIFLI
ncbi:MAG: sodium:proton antiporter, partial [bacterium]